MIWRESEDTATVSFTEVIFLMKKSIDKKINTNAVKENMVTAELCKNSEIVLKESIAMGLANLICLR